jgi:hypothetical protein
MSHFQYRSRATAYLRGYHSQRTPKIGQPLSLPVQNTSAHLAPSGLSLLRSVSHVLCCLCGLHHRLVATNGGVSSQSYFCAQKSLGQHFSLGHSFWSWLRAWASSWTLFELTISRRQFWHYRAAISDTPGCIGLEPREYARWRWAWGP